MNEKRCLWHVARSIAARFIELRVHQSQGQPEHDCPRYQGDLASS
jgi:hypothetical protein